MVQERPTGANIEHPGHHDEKDEMFFRMLRRFPPQAQELVTSLSSVFMEVDEYEAFRSDPARVAGLKSELSSMGLRSRQVRQVMRFFNLTPSVEPKVIT